MLALQSRVLVLGRRDFRSLPKASTLRALIDSNLAPKISKRGFVIMMRIKSGVKGD